jgi:hypothetical protein
VPVENPALQAVLMDLEMREAIGERHEASDFKTKTQGKVGDSRAAPGG